MLASPPSSVPPPASPAGVKPPSVADAQREALARAVARWSSRFGSASTAELERQALAALAGRCNETEPLCGSSSGRTRLASVEPH
jgi:hypothetical protein